MKENLKKNDDPYERSRNCISIGDKAIIISGSSNQ
jgi:hypothetical protein